MYKRQALLLILLIIGLILKSIKPELFIDKAKLQAKGLSIVPAAEYANLIDFKEQQLINPNTEEITETASNNDYQNTQESIGSTTVYAVQIGAFVNNDIGLYSESFTQFNEFKADDFYIYSLGALETLEEAQQFRESVVNLGFNDAFVTSYQNGERIPIENPY